MREDDFDWKGLNMLKGDASTKRIIKKMTDKEQWKWKKAEEEIAVKEPGIKEKIW